MKTSKLARAFERGRVSDKVDHADGFVSMIMVRRAGGGSARDVSLGLWASCARNL